MLAPNAAIPAGLRRKLPAHDAGAPCAAGVIHVAPDGDILLLRRSSAEKNYAGHWALPGGGAEPGETPEQAAERECGEEMGSAPGGPLKVIDRRTTPTGMTFHTFARPVDDKFAPKLNAEHTGYAWAPLDQLPGPLHPAVRATLKERLGAPDVAGDMSPEDWQGLRAGLLRWLDEEELEPEHAGDSALRLALDQGSARQFDVDGRMRLDRVHISKANVCPYRGCEIPRWKELGLEPDRIYQLYRDPAELKKAAESSNGVQLLRKHVPVSAEDPQHWDVVGATGTDGKFDGEYLDNSITIWTKEAIDGVESDRQKELSMGYHYDAEMTGGKIGDTEFDGVMRNIVVNHVALVEQGRAGPDVVVGDSMEGLMTKPTRIAALALGYTARAVNPLLAADAKVNYGPLFSGLTSKTFDAKKLAKDVATLIKGKTIAKDASTEHVATMLEALEHAGKKEPSADESVSEPQHKAMMAAAEGKSNLGIPKDVGQEFKQADTGKSFHDAVPEFLRGKGMSEDDIGNVMSMLPKPATAGDEDDEEAKKKAEAEKKAKEEKAAADAEVKSGEEKKAMDERLKGMISKPAMDEAITAAVAAERKNGSETRAAFDFVRPWVGDIPSAIAMGLDTAAKVHRHALKTLAVDGADKIHESALEALIKAQRKPGAQGTDGARERERPIAADSASRKDFAERFPGSERIKAA